jgi:hypothetical protein
MSNVKTNTQAVVDIGTITIRVVVLTKNQEEEATASVAPEDASPDEMLPERGRSPVRSYLEDPKRGRLCCVFLVNGQRQHAWDNAFIVRDLEFKYLRNRMMVIVEVDGIRPEAFAELMQGSRSNFYEGRVYDAVSARVIAVLKGDEDLKRLEAEAEAEISSLRSGDEAVKGALDELIDAHFEATDRATAGTGQHGAETRQGNSGSTTAAKDAVIRTSEDIGVAAAEPVIVLIPDTDYHRLEPNKVRRLLVACQPSSAWPNLESLKATVNTHSNEFNVTVGKITLGAHIDVTFHEPEGMDQDDYPIETVLRVEAHFKGHPEMRLLERPLRVLPPVKRKHVLPVLLLEPTWLRVGGRQPLRLLAHGPDLHVRCRWNGKDELVSANPAQWFFTAKCLSRADWPPFAFSQPSGGRFELLIRPADGINLGDILKFQITAHGPSGKTLSADFECQVVEPIMPSDASVPRRISTTVSTGQQRRPPYDLKYVDKSTWASTPCWDESEWCENDVACFQAPTPSAPLTLVLNTDFIGLTEYRESLIRRKLVEATIKERETRYSAHVAYHLYQMYIGALEADKQANAAGMDTPDRVSDEAEHRAEITRVAGTLLRLMEFSR